ncbi:hypothetical protein CK203_021174 [Vitis vinifera]|uniref:Pectinesterase inhibitor domain-containing protein n=1 Tax=Vitis vinifera TaxID=29760 RepID=A0A438IMC3_VITVI|nr:hypothetical protein CK203_021174 [Vitis vinifera]
MNTISGVFFILILAFWPHQILAQEDQDLGLIIPNQKSSLGEELIAQVCDHAIYKDLCINALDRIEDSLKALESKGYNDVNTWVTAAMADAESCEEGFLDRPGHKSPLTGRSTIFNQLCSTALTITNFLSGSV